MADVLIIEDEETLLATLSLELQRAGHTVVAAHDGATGLRAVKTLDPNIALVDIKLPDIDGVEIIEQFRQTGHDFPIVVMTAYGTVGGAVEAMRRGATDYLQKPVGIDELQIVIERALKHRQLFDRLRVFERERERHGAERSVIGSSSAIRRTLALADRMAAVPVDECGRLPTVLLTGETGTGKDLLAHRLHDLGPHRESPFVQINCSALPGQLIEAELFGHERGAFTGADETRKGLFESADDGTVFLDEIGEMPLELQAKLLLVLENRSMRRIGDTRERNLRARVIAATNVNLQQRVDDGRFRSDLMFRLQSLAIELPPLRERDDDVLLIAEHLIAQQARRLHRAPPQLSVDAKARMRRYVWPGNIRELDNVIQRAVLLSDGDEIGEADLNLSGGNGMPPTALSDIRFPFGAQPFTLMDIEQLAARQAVEACDGNVSQAARLLGISRGALRHRLENEST